MTLLDDPTRTYRDPVEIAAKALLKAAYYDGDEAQYHGIEDFYRNVESGVAADASRQAKAMLAALDKRGFLSPLYYDAIEARKKRK